MAPKPLIHADLRREIGIFTDTRKFDIGKIMIWKKAFQTVV